MIKLEYVPNGLDEIIKYYGKPWRINEKNKRVVDLEWKKANLSYFCLPFSLRKSWNQQEIKGFVAHKKVGAAMIDALLEIEEYAGLPFLQRYELDQWGGVYNFRSQYLPNGKRGPLSTHAWAIAIDYCHDLGPVGEKSRMPHFIVEAFTKRGFVGTEIDGQHHQAARNY